MARTLGPQVWQSRTNDPKWREHVHLEQPLCFGIRGFLERAE
jgi:hypothetical protein